MGEHYETLKLGDFLEKGGVFQNKVKAADSHGSLPLSFEMNKIGQNKFFSIRYSDGGYYLSLIRFILLK